MIEARQPNWAREFYAHKRYKGVYGGRGSGKSYAFAQMLVHRHLENPDTISLCLREYQKDLDSSVKPLIEKFITALGVEDRFKVTNNAIRSSKSGNIQFSGMQDWKAESVKSRFGLNIVWVEEAQTLSKKSVELLRPTIRDDNSELWCTWNPRYRTDPVDVLFRNELPAEHTICKHVNFDQNPWMTNALEIERALCYSRDPSRYPNVWLGEYDDMSESLVFSNWKVKDFESPSDAFYRFGADWGYAKDPTVLIRSFIDGRTIFVDYECHMTGCDIVDIPTLFASVPDSDKWPIIADSSRPETIAFMRKNGYPKIFPSIKGARSVEHGIEWLKSFDIVVHPRCDMLIEELKSYRYKVDKSSGAVMPVLEDKNNHLIDALRYSHEQSIRSFNSDQRKPIILTPVTLRSWPHAGQ